MTLFRLGNRFLSWFCDPTLLPEIQGDLHELHQRWTQEYGVKKAQWLYLINVITFLRPFAVSKRKNEPYHALNHMAMFKNYFKIAIRNLLKQKAYSILNILGLALGIACVFLIAMHIHDELSYENSFPQHERIYRVSLEGWAKSAPSMAQSLEEYIPEIQQTARFYYMYPKILRYGEFQSEEDQGYMADSTVFSMFNFKLIQGDPQQVFLAPYSMVITESMAKKYFGDENPVGKILDNAGTDFHITGVMEDLPANTHLKINFLVSMATFYKEIPDNWTGSQGWMATYTYVLFNHAGDTAKVKARMPELLVHYYEGRGTPEEILANTKWMFMPMDDIHLHSKLVQEMGANSDVTYVYIFGAIGIFILLIASINFINIFTTQSLKRMKEVGIRRIVGAMKNQLLWQFLGEALMVTLMASLLAILLFEAALPFYNQLSGKQMMPGAIFSTGNLLMLVAIMLAVALLSGLYPAFFVSGFSPLKALAGAKKPRSSAGKQMMPGAIFSTGNLLMLGAIMLVVALLSGLYPAFFVSGFSPLKALAGAKKPRSSAGILRKTLMVFQFVVAVFMIASTLVVYQQMQYFHNKDLGFDKDQVVAVSLFGALKEKFVENPEAIESALMTNPDISNVGVASNLPGDELSVEMVVPDGTPEDRELPTVRVIRVDENYLPTLHIALSEGRNFSSQFNDSAAFIINETAARALGIENPVGSYVTNQTRDVHGPIIGVIKDYHFASLHNPMEPLVLEYNPSWSGFLMVKLKGGKIRETLSSLEAKIHELVPDYLFNYQFLDDRINLLYQDEAKMSTLFKFFAAFAIVISCLGLFGLSAHASEVRTKEIAIRKTIGATVAQLVQLLSREFMVLVIIGNVIAWPLAWWGMHRWLENFTYHVSIHWSVFVIASMLSVFVAVFTVSYHAIRTALANPVDSLRNE